jgi:hypothetical protein
MKVSKRLLEKYVRSILFESVDHDEILDRAKREVVNEESIAELETLYQNVAHLTIALEEVEGRKSRVTNKLKRLGISDVDKFLKPLEESIVILKEKIVETESSAALYISDKSGV